MLELYVLRPEETDGGNNWRREFEILVASHSSGQPQAQAPFWLQFVQGGPPTEDEIGSGSAPERLISTGGEPVRVLPREYWSKTAAGFELQPGQVNEWTIPLPEELLQAVRTKLKAKK
jgi:hypothetical protein